MGKYYSYAVIHGVVHVFWDNYSGTQHHKIMSEVESAKFIEILNAHDVQIQRRLCSLDDTGEQP